MKNANKNLDTIIHGDSLEKLAELESASIDLVLTDPPYFLDKMDNNWKHEVVGNQRNQQVIKSLPAGMKFDREQGRRFYDWYLKISERIFKVLKPGGFFLSFSSPRLYHRMASAVDDAGFEVRDCLIWLYTQNQMKAMGLDHFVDKSKFPANEKRELKAKFLGWKTPQLKSCFEPIVMAQKPTEGTYLQNAAKYEVGLINTHLKVGENMQVANVLSTEKINDIVDKVFLVGKPTKSEKGNFNIHQTVKPLALCEHLIKLFTFNNSAVVLDPFLGSGTTAVAAKRLGKHYIGIEINKEYINVAEKRISETDRKILKLEPVKAIPKQQTFALAS
jgi:site-specific DNA-methyltransferase (adenine-specific)